MGVKSQFEILQRIAKILTKSTNRLTSILLDGTLNPLLNCYGKSKIKNQAIVYD